MTSWIDVPVRRIQPAVLLLQLAVESHGCYIAGGYARWACSTHDDTPPANDIDVICPSQRKLDSLRGHFQNSGYTLLCDGEYSYTFRYPGIDKKVQLLKAFKGDTIQECLNQFDFGVCRIALTSHETAIADAHFTGDDQRRTVRIYHIKEGMETNTLQRLVRYARKGFDIAPSTVEKAMKQLVKVTEEKCGFKRFEPKDLATRRVPLRWGSDGLS